MPSRLLFILLPLALSAQKVPIENAYARVLDVTDLPHARTPLHEHPLPRVMIYLTDCDTQIVEGGKVTQQHRSAGSVAWSPAGGRHTAENLRDTACRIIEIEVKPGQGRTAVAAGPLDPVVADPKHYRVLIDNDEVRVLRAHYAPGETGAMHEHLRDRITVPLTNSTLRVISPAGKSETRIMHAGEPGWASVARHQEVNSGDGPFEVIAVEFKRR